MSFMYQSMMTRAPGKRKIKLQEENILRMMQDEEDEDEDEDFKIGSEKLLEDSDDSSKDSSASSLSSKAEESSDEENNKNMDISTSSKLKESSPSKRRRNRHHKYTNPTVKSTAEYLNSQYRDCPPNIRDILVKAKKQLEISSAQVSKSGNLSNLKSCCICLNSKNIETIISCCKCGVTVHKDCYQWIKHKRKRSKDSWFCDLCVSGKDANCELCPSTQGCIKETTTGQWCHVVCARYILKQQIYSTKGQNIVIDFSNLDYRLYNKKECFLCEDRLFSKTGMSVKCDAGLCKTHFHVTCAQKHGLLAENETELNNETDPYFVYCPIHLEKEKMLKSQKTFLSLFAAMDSKEKHNKEIYDDEELKKLRTNYVRHKPATTPVRPIEPRSLCSNAHALKLLNEKAERMFGINVRNPSCYFPRPSEVRKRHRIPPSLTPEFASHLMDRHLRIAEAERRVGKAVEENGSLLEEQEELRGIYNKSQEKLKKSQTERNNIYSKSQNLFTFITRLKQWSQENTQNRLDNQPFTKIRKPIYKTPVEVVMKRQRKRSLQNNKITSPVAAKHSKQVDVGSILKQCNVCRSDGGQHLLVDCDLCKKWIHLKCLEPPLTQMPKKTKFSMWQCSECSLVSSDENSDTPDITHGSLITAEGRRQTRRSHKPPNKLSTMLFDDCELAEQRKMINLISNKFRKSHNQRKERLNRNRKRRREKRKLMLASTANQRPKDAKTDPKMPETNKTTSTSLTKTPVQNIAEKFNLAEARVIIDRNSTKNHIVPPKPTPNYHVEARKLQSTTNILEALGKLVKTNKSVTIVSKKAAPDLASTSSAEKSNNSAFPKKNRAAGQFVGKKIGDKSSEDCTDVSENKKTQKTGADEIVDKKIEDKSNNYRIDDSENNKSPKEGVDVIIDQKIEDKSNNNRINVGENNNKTCKEGQKIEDKSNNNLHSNSENENSPKKTLNHSNDAHTSPKTDLDKKLTSQIFVPITSTQLMNVSVKVKISNNLPSNVTVEKNKNICDEDKNDAIKQPLSVCKKQDTPQLSTKTVELAKCKKCDMCEEQNKMLLCDKCKSHYHIWCCEPPFEQMPRKCRGTFWECSDCVLSSDDDQVNDSPQMGGLKVDEHGSKRTTRRRKPPEKFSNDFYSASQSKILQNVISQRKKQKLKNRKSRKVAAKKKPSTPNTLNSNRKNRHIITFLKHMKPVSIVKPIQPPPKVEQNQLDPRMQFQYHDMHNYIKKPPENNTPVKTVLPRLSVNVLHSGNTPSNSCESNPLVKIEPKQLAKGVNFIPILSGKQLKFVCNSVNSTASKDIGKLPGMKPMFNPRDSQLPQNTFLISTKPVSFDPNSNNNSSLDLTNVNFVSCTPSLLTENSNSVQDGSKKTGANYENSLKNINVMPTSDNIIHLVQHTESISKMSNVSNVYSLPSNDNNSDKIPSDVKLEQPLFQPKS